jgi:hypothetical protein
MGHDYIDIGNSQLRLNDFHIWTLRHFLLDAATKVTPDLLNADEASYRELVIFLDSWQWLGPGIIVGCNFNSFTTSLARFSLIVQLLKVTRENLASFGATIPLSYLDNHVNSPAAWYTTATPVVTFTDIIDRMIGLIQEKLPDGQAKF